MKNFYKIGVIVYFFVVLFVVQEKLYSQGFRYGVPRHKVFSAKDYNGHPQVWVACGLPDKEVIFGTTRGVLFYNGTFFRKYFQNISFRYLLADSSSDKIYYGGDYSFGYMHKDSIGKYEIVDFSNMLPEKYKDFLYSYGIGKYKDYFYVAGFHRFFIYKNDSLIKTFKPKTDFRFLYHPDDSSYYTFEIGTGLLKVTPDTLFPISNNEFVAMRGVNDMAHWNDSTYLMAVARPYELYFYNKFTGDYKLVPNFPSFVKNPVALKILKDGKIAVGTKNDGVYILNRDFSVYAVFNVDNGLIDNDISFLYQDSFDNIWITTYSGIGVIYDYNGFFEISNKLGAVPSSCIIDSSLFLATSTGLYHYYIPSNFMVNNPIVFDKVYLDKFQVLSVIPTKYKDILMNSTIGVFVYKNNKVKKILNSISLSINRSRFHDDIVYISSTEGLVIAKYINNEWTPIDTIKIPKFMREVFEQNDSTLFVRTDDNIFLKIKSKKPLSCPNNSFDYKSISNGKRLYHFFLNDTIFGIESTHIYYLDFSKDSFIVAPNWTIEVEDKRAFPVLSLPVIKRDTTYITSCGETFTKFRISGTHIYISNHDYLSLNSSNIYTVSYDSIRNLMWGVSLEKIYNVPLNYKNKIYPFDTKIYSVSLTSDSVLLLNGAKKSIVLPYKNNSLRFEYSAIFYNYPEQIKYSYTLANFDTSWSTYSNDKFAIYTNLPPGTYVFKVKAKNIYGTESSVATFKFTVLPPWYMTWWAYLLYFMLFIGIIYLAVRFYTYKLKQKNIALEKVVEERTKEIRSKNKELYKKNTQITESIKYAKKIQDAIIPDEKALKELYPQSFVLFRPRDIVSGDFFWVYKINEKEKIVVLADCTGHGVPGAFMSIVGNTLLNKLVKENGIYAPSKILSLLHIGVVESLQEGHSGEAIAEDGMDMIICKINEREKTINVASANQTGFFFIDGKLIKIFGDPFAVGDPFARQKEIIFEEKEIKYNEKAILYFTSDGYYDQFGGEGGNKKFTMKRFIELLDRIKEHDVEKQREELEKVLDEWKSNTMQLDDILVIGIKI